MADTTVAPTPASTAPTIEPTRFRTLMSTFPTGVAVVTAGGPDETPSGLTVSSVSSVSLDPPTLLVCIDRNSRTLRTVREAGAFAVNLLHAGARSTATLFASGDPHRFEGVEWRNSPEYGGPHLLDDTHASADCRVSHTVRVGDHEVIFGEIFRVQQEDPDEANPLLYGMRTFAPWHTASG